MHVRLLPIALVVLLGTGGCAPFFDGLRPVRADAPRASVATSVPDDRLTVVADADPVAAAAAMSRTLFDRAPVVVVARDGDRPGLLLAASAAVAMGVPLLLEPGDGGPSGVVAEEVARLGAGSVLAVGETVGAVGPGTDVVPVPSDAGAVAAATGVAFDEVTPVSSRNEPAAVAALDRDAPVALIESPATSPVGGTAASLPELEPADPLKRTVVLATGEAASTAAVATARAAGVPVALTSGETDPRRSEDAVSALSAVPWAEPPAVVAVGAGFAEEDGLDWKVETAAAGTELPGGGQVLFPGRLLVALYGHPGSPALGILGEQDAAAAIERARAHAAPYEALVEDPVVPAFEIIATIASSAPGADGDYSAEAPPEDLRPWVEAAGEAGLYVVLDLQPGRTDFLTQAQRYESLLELPHVGLALDPEWRLAADGVHLTQVGSVAVDEVNAVVGWLADLTRERALPQKLLVLHQFRLKMIDGRERLDTSRDELAVMVHADGQGSQGDKQATWRTLHQNPPAGLVWGWKNFYDEDAPMLTPEQTIGQVRPRPDLISYQ